MTDRFAGAQAVADAVLFEGYLLYPYRASAAKNRVRWQWGVLVPQGWGADSGETSANRTECLVELRGLLHLRVRYLHLETRTVLDTSGNEVDALIVGDARHVPFEEGLPRHTDATLTRAELLAGVTIPITEPATTTAEEVPGGRVVRTREALAGAITVGATELPGPYDVLRLRIDVRCVPAHAEPDTDDPHAGDPGWGDPGHERTSRARALRRSLIGTHVMLAAEGSFVSPTDPPEWAAGLVATCRSEHLWPALAGGDDRSDLLLSAPIIVGDHARIADESPIDLFDGTENDEILTLRTMVLTDEEKAEARATDPRAAALVDAVDALPPEILERLHGAIRTLRPVGSSRAPDTAWGRVDGIPTLHTPRGGDAPDAVPPATTPWWDPAADSSVDPETDSVLVGSTPVAKGSAVILRPGLAGSDAQDAFLAGMRATVQAVVHDVDGRVHVAVSIDGDPAAELQIAHGRHRYFRPDELETPT
jgi:hypothetical protein